MPPKPKGSPKGSPRKRKSSVRFNPTPTVHDNTVTYPRCEKLGFLGTLCDLDEGLTKMFAVCANSESSAGHMRPFMKLLEWSCHGVPWIVGVFFWILVTHSINLHHKLLNFLVLLLFDCLVIVVIKVIFRRRRPVMNQDDMLSIAVDQFSFPSGHASRASLVLLFILNQFAVPIPWDNTLTFWSLAVALSRVAMGRHHVFDVWCGYILGIAEYYFHLNYLWLSKKMCESIIAPIQEELHI